MKLISLQEELRFKTSRSAGKGGQHVNKTSTKVELFFDIKNSELLSEEDKIRIEKKLSNRITSEGVLVMKCEETRSQLTNKKILINRFLELVENALLKPKKRKPTKPSIAAKENRIKKKKERGEIKKIRSKKIQ
ncbi:MAG: aminoacyl-tRNA hydrolase [Bacteroidetes bacterium]|nr:aminoacyl-tRNA hydrolase [Bacteroidota bacterium]MBV6459947.1 Peptidyl-tRNA hydrolase ArfB [Flavobacteriales bacterium]WKZ76408.1 MAG: alternative ribosome rescue aminoacyl-tRNA hydrolase ArfB [Vicingaceae bacterium]MCL4816329.1 aminoacyl-tRNA hydrolase [Flavobacteriales bacterium]NOG95343.1 aminoacyl-tRNA hydrolase [Bacteroidota bacterium]